MNTAYLGEQTTRITLEESQANPWWINLVLYNSGSMPGKTEKIRFSVLYENQEIDSSLAILIKLYPRQELEQGMAFEGFAVAEYFSALDSLFKAKLPNCIDKLRFKFVILYRCEEIGKKYTSISTWKRTSGGTYIRGE